MRSFFVSILFTYVVLAGTAIQTDWSGGGGVQGPVSDWGDTFWSSDVNTDYNAGKLQLLLVPIEHIVDSDFNSAHSVCAADVDGDGDTDMLGAAANADDITWWENTDGTGTSWVEHTVDGDFIGPCSVSAPDVDGDGDMDVLGSSAFTEGIAWWENTDGTGTSWTEHTVDGDFDGAHSLYSVDVDGDGDTDVLGAGGNSIVYLENTDGSGTSWTEHTVDGNYDGAESVYAADLDGDGDTDLLGAAFFADEITWWENTDGTGTSWTEHTVDGSFDGACSVYAADVNGDGSTDILGAAWLANEITWWDVLGLSTGALESSILDAGDVGEWSIFLSNSQEPAGTSVSFQFRSSDDSSNMGAWSDTVYSPDTPLGGILDNSTRYLQYRVILETSVPVVSPELAEVAFAYTQVGIGESESGEVPSWSLHSLENPSHGFFSAVVTIPEDISVELSLYDVSGRVVAEVSQELPAGTHAVNFTGLAEGVYFSTMCAGEFSATERIVVID